MELFVSECNSFDPGHVARDLAFVLDVRPAIHHSRVHTNRGYKPTLHEDMRQMLDDPQIDAVVMATPDHWHCLASIWACQAGKDVYVEKPVSNNPWEGRQLVRAARRHGRIVQVGTQNRSAPYNLKANVRIR